MSNIQETKNEVIETTVAKSTEELLQEMLLQQKKSSKFTRIAAFSVIFCAVLLTAALVITIPRFMGFIEHAEKSLSEVDKLMLESEAAFSEINEAAEEANTMLSQTNDVIMPKAVKFIDHAESSLSDIDKLIAEADKSMDDIETATVKLNSVLDEASVLIENTNTMVESNTDAITETVQKLNNVDFEALNKAIQDLSTIVGSLSRFFK